MTPFGPIKTTVVAAAVLAVVIPLGASSAQATQARPSPCTESVPFISGQAGYAIYRIPAVVQTNRGTVVVFAEGRASSADAGSIDIVSRRSHDDGCTWGPLSVVADEGADTIGNPAPVIDPSSGEIVLLSTRNAGTAGEGAILRGEVAPADSRRVFVQISSDDGRTFSALREITDDTKRADWRWYATGPGHAIALTKGPHRGRLVVPANHSIAPPVGSTDTGAEAKYYGAHSLYSDDSGASWQIGFSDDNPDGYLNTNESTAAELPDGRVYFNSREHNGTAPGTRADAISDDGGVSLSSPYRPQIDLIGPVVEGSVLQVRGHGSPLLFSGPSDPAKRASMAIRVSLDNGGTWQNHFLVSTAPAAYSDLVQLQGSTIGLLYETGATSSNETITFRRESIREIVT